MMDLSIIIPVYNTEKYLSKCIDSCLSNEADKNLYELIIIDDGSTDSSLSIAKDYEKQFPNIRVYTQKNQRQGAARNNGLTKAKGEYIWFIDSDDWISDKAVDFVLKQIKKHQLDLLRFDSIDFFEKTEAYKKRPCLHVAGELYNGHQLLVENEFSVCVPFYIFKKDFFHRNNLKFEAGMFYEDNEFMLKVLENTSSFMYVKEALYYVNKTDNSSTRSQDLSRNFDLIKVIRSHIEYVESKKLKDELVKVFSISIVRCINKGLLATAESRDIFNQFIQRIQEIDNIEYYIRASKSVFHVIQFKLFKSPTFLRLLMLVYKLK